MEERYKDYATRAEVLKRQIILMWQLQIDQI